MAFSSTIESLLFTQRRQFAGIIPDVTIEENHTDTLTITDHPVEYAPTGQTAANATVSDHAFTNPSEVSCKFGWSQQMALLNSIFSGGLFSGSSSLQQLYQQLLALQSSRVPFDLSTGKRQYKNMLIKSLSVITEAATENVLMVSIVFRQIITVQTQPAALVAEHQASPQKTAATQNVGTKALQPTNQSALSKLLGN